ncbi:putative bifunctional diguanylate cyclase/phosphodiesterase [Aurantimonas marianensis]|uniref:EAL domain-containing protein n=1 Tax=Aurantimonas marianensis TaxID=2920428 RepID=A0A9X2KFP4_9HYPH|nr:EAL domain-containing protein [Aurantimonas marianensis]MCP3055450.1 EAL domain-containing protein [Aurantimonas marianensis]
MSSRFRGVQINNILKFTPIMMLGNMVSATVIFPVAHEAGLASAFLIWCAPLLYFVFAAARSRDRIVKSGYLQTASRRAIERAKLSALLLGSWWSITILVIYPAADSGGKAIAATIVVGLISGSAFALCALPAAMLNYMLPVIAGGATALLLSGNPHDILFTILLCAFSFIVIQSGLGRAQLIKASFEDQQKLAEQSAIIELLLRDFEEGTSDWLWETDAGGTLTRGIERFSQFRCKAQAANDMPPDGSTTLQSILSCSGGMFQGHSPISDHLAARTPFRDQVIEVGARQASRWMSISGKPIFDCSGEFIGFRGVASDITAAREAEIRIHYLAHHDSLTGLANRAHFAEQIEAILREDDCEGPVGSIFYLDLDNFKAINDTRGHTMGDRLLKAVGARLKDVVGPEDTVSRIGGDEYAIIARSARDENAAGRLATAILESFARPFDLGSETACVGSSVGIAFPGKDGKTAEHLLKSADLALYHAKEEGKRTYRFFTLAMARQRLERHRLEQDLRDAIGNGELFLQYQPLIHNGTRRTVGFEALLRWQHPEHGRVTPDRFIPLAEEIGAITEIGAWVIHQACGTAASWPEELSVAVNVSAHQFKDGGIVEAVRDALARTGLRPDRLELEITESVLIDDAQQVVEILHKLRNIGVKIALDDFGTGYSSLSYLRRFAFDKLKIDRSFVSAIKDDPVARGILETIMILGRVLDLCVTAEGVEDDAQLAILSKLNCSQLQGYYFSPPMAETDVGGYLLNEFRRSAVAASADVPRLAKSLSAARD